MTTRNSAVEQALRTIDDDPDPLHADVTPSVHALGAMGLAAVPGVLDLMISEDQMTRLHAQRALEAILDRRLGFVPGRGYPSRAAEEARVRSWKAHGGYRHDAPADVRATSVAAWRAWLAAQPDRP
jgi:hypothetical protein